MKIFVCLQDLHDLVGLKFCKRSTFSQKYVTSPFKLRDFRAFWCTPIFFIYLLKNWNFTLNNPTKFATSTQKFQTFVWTFFVGFKTLCSLAWLQTRKFSYFLRKSMQKILYLCHFRTIMTYFAFKLHNTALFWSKSKNGSSSFKPTRLNL